MSISLHLMIACFAPTIVLYEYMALAQKTRPTPRPRRPREPRLLASRPAEGQGDHDAEHQRRHLRESRRASAQHGHACPAGVMHVFGGTTCLTLLV